MTRIEQFIFITPKAKHNDIPDNYKEFINNELIFPNVDDTIKKIIDKDTNINIDCFNIRYFNKCKLIDIINYDVNNFISKIKTHRE